MYRRRRARSVGLLLGVVLGWVLTGCATATPAPVVPQDAATATPTALPSATLPPLITATPTETATEVPTATPTTTSTATLTTTPTAVPTSTPTPSASEWACVPQPVTGAADVAPPAGDPGVYTVIGVAADDRLNVRACPGVGHPIVYELAPFSVGLIRAGQDSDVEGSPWTPISYGEAVGWVNAGYLARQFGAADTEVTARAGQIVRALRDQDWATVSGAVHPKGVRFSPYTYVRLGAPGDDDVDRVFTAVELAGLAADETVYRWGRFDGSGEPIEMSFVEYYARFIYDADFAWAYAVGYNVVVGGGNTVNNLAEVYPQAQVVEFYLPGADPRYAGMDWRSLRLVLEKADGIWYLVGIGHDEWTI